MLRRSLIRCGGGDKSVFAKKRRVIQPMKPNPNTPQSYIKYISTTDPLKVSTTFKLYSSGAELKNLLDQPERLEGTQSRKKIFKQTDPEFQALQNFVRGANYDQLVSGRRFREAYEAISDKDDVIIWLCMTSMAVLNPGDVQSRLIYRHLEALAKAVANGEMTQRTAFRFYETAVRSPAYRAIAKQQLQNGSSTRLAGITSAADLLRDMGVCRRPMSSYFELYQRIVERSEALSPWGFPPLFQFEEHTELFKRLKFFERESGQNRVSAKKRGSLVAKRTKVFGPHIIWIPPTWKTNSRWLGNQFVSHPGVIAD